MLHCKSCGVEVSGVHKTCPLCGGNLSGETTDKRDYPVITEDHDRIKKLIQLISVGAVIAAIICVSINMLIPTETRWSLFVVFGLGCGWLWAIIGIIKKSIILNNIVWQLILISTVCFFWDRFTGKLGWSVDFVFPILCVCAMIAVIILSQVLHIKAGDYIINLILCSLTGVIPMILIFTGIVRIIIPSVICSAVALIIIFVQIIFNYKVMYSEICKKLHM